MSDGNEEQPKQYAVRFYERALRDINEATVDYLDYTGDGRRARTATRCLLCTFVMPPAPT